MEPFLVGRSVSLSIERRKRLKTILSQSIASVACSFETSFIQHSTNRKLHCRKNVCHGNYENLFIEVFLFCIFSLKRKKRFIATFWLTIKCRCFAAFIISTQYSETRFLSQTMIVGNLLFISCSPSQEIEINIIQWQSIMWKFNFAMLIADDVETSSIECRCNLGN